MGHGNSAPELPEIKDEASDSPSWLPLLGAGIFATFLIWVIFVKEHKADTTAADQGSEVNP